jgi:hypothetical protein
MVRPARGKSIEFYQAKLDKYLAEYEQAKRDHNADRVHKLRGNISQQKARIRYIQHYGYEF